MYSITPWAYPDKAKEKAELQKIHAAVKALTDAGEPVMFQNHLVHALSRRIEAAYDAGDAEKSEFLALIESAAEKGERREAPGERACRVSM